MRRLNDTNQAYIASKNLPRCANLIVGFAPHRQGGALPPARRQPPLFVFGHPDMSLSAGGLLNIVSPTSQKIR